MTLDQLEGRYESAPHAGPGMRYVLELEGPRAGLKPGERFSLTAAAWGLSPARRAAGGQPVVELIGNRRLEGSYRSEGSGFVLHVLHLTDTPAGLAVTGGAARPITRAVDEQVPVQIVLGASVSLRFKLYGSEVLVTRL